MPSFSVQKYATSAVGTNWINPARAKIQNGTFARNSTGDTLTLSNFGFEIPDGALINGVKITATRRASVTGMLESVMLIAEGHSSTSTGWSIPRRVRTRNIGSSTSIPTIIGGFLSPSDVNATSFGVMYSKAFIGTVFVDGIVLTVYYTTA